jgi:hypothetical protein
VDRRRALLDRFIPVYDVAERHHIHVAAPAEITYAAACEQDLMTAPVAQMLFKAREVLLGSEPDTAARPRGLLAITKSLGWSVLAEAPEFVAFTEPDHVKIAWTLRADAIGTNASIFRTETRVVATDATARAKFRRYWSFLSPGIILIRWAALRPLKADAERRGAARHGTLQ